MLHQTDIKTRGTQYLPVYVVVCSCGYVSRPYELKKNAVHDEDEHIRLIHMAND